MKVFKTVKEVFAFRKNNSKKTGFVPTMGALHAGHLSLINLSKTQNETTGCSIFVNPIQFNNAEDFEKYPLTVENDLQQLEATGCDWVFVPSVSEMYPGMPELKFNFGNLETVMEGAFRPGHFNGVAIVVAKLFNAVIPDCAYFGQKDLQQTLVIKRLVTDLGFNLEIIVGDTLREVDGLAMSSRNVRLSAEERKIAPLIFHTLSTLKDNILMGQDIAEALTKAKAEISANPHFRLEYLDVANTTDLLPVTPSYKGEMAACIAAYLGNVRLIDNIVFTKE